LRRSEGIFMQFPSKAWRTEARVLGSTAAAVTATMAAQLTISFVETLAAARLGTPVLAGVTLALSLYLLVFLFALGLVTAITPLAAQAHGRDDAEAVRAIGQQGLLVGLVASTPASLLLLAAGAWLAVRPGATVEAVAAGHYLLGAAWGCLPGSATFPCGVWRSRLGGCGSPRPSWRAPCRSMPS